MEKAERNNNTKVDLKSNQPSKQPDVDLINTPEGNRSWKQYMSFFENNLESLDEYINYLQSKNCDDDAVE